jgi:hypothetical protein
MPACRQEASMKITFSRSRSNPDAWDLCGPQGSLVEGAIVEVEKSNGTTLRKVCGTELRKFTSRGGIDMVVCEINPHLTVAQAEKAARKAAKAAKAAKSGEVAEPSVAPVSSLPVGVRLPGRV